MPENGLMQRSGISLRSLKDKKSTGQKFRTITLAYLQDII